MHRGSKKEESKLKQTRDQLLEQTRVVRQLSSRKSFSVFLVVEHSRKRTHAHVYSCGRRTKPPAIPSYPLIESNRVGRNQKKKREIEEKEPDSQFNNHVKTPSAEENAIPDRMGSDPEKKK